MNYAQVLEKIAQLKIGKKTPDAEKFLEKYPFKKVIYIPAEYEYDFLGEILELIFKEQKLSVGCYTPYAINSPLGYMRYQGKNISQKDFSQFAGGILDEAEKNHTEISKTEIYLQIALEYFFDKKVDFFILPSLHKCSIEGIKELLSETAVLEREQTAIEAVAAWLKSAETVPAGV